LSSVSTPALSPFVDLFSNSLLRPKFHVKTFMTFPSSSGCLVSLSPLAYLFPLNDIPAWRALLPFSFLISPRCPACCLSCPQSFFSRFSPRHFRWPAAPSFFSSTLSPPPPPLFPSLCFYPDFSPVQVFNRELFGLLRPLGVFFPVFSVFLALFQAFPSYVSEDSELFCNSRGLFSNLKVFPPLQCPPRLRAFRCPLPIPPPFRGVPSISPGMSFYS